MKELGKEEKPEIAIIFSEIFWRAVLQVLLSCMFVSELKFSNKVEY